MGSLGSDDLDTGILVDDYLTYVFRGRNANTPSHTVPFPAIDSTDESACRTTGQIQRLADFVFAPALLPVWTRLFKPVGFLGET